MRAIDVTKKLCPKARKEYLIAMENIDPLLKKYEINTPLRLAHFLAQGFHECNGLTIVRESGKYTASRILEIFGVGRHSAKVTPAQAKQLAGDEFALFERVYGKGNPFKAKELGNTSNGDGYNYRGNGFLQTTGRAAHRRLGQKVGVGDLFERNPAMVTAIEYCYLPALEEWRESRCNELADKNDLAGITRRINGGYNGKADRQNWFNRIYPLLKANGIAWQDAKEDGYIHIIQEQLETLGLYTGEIDGKKGPKTEAAIREFQRMHNLAVDGIAGPVTKEALFSAVEANRAPVRVDAFPEDRAMKSGAVQGGTLAAGASAGGLGLMAFDVKNALDDAKTSLDGSTIGIAFFAVFLAIGLYIVWNRYKSAGRLPAWLGG